MVDDYDLVSAFPQDFIHVSVLYKGSLGAAFRRCGECGVARLHQVLTLAGCEGEDAEGGYEQILFHFPFLP